MNGSGSGGASAKVKNSANVPAVSGGSNPIYCLCNLESLPVPGSTIGVGVLLERVERQFSKASMSLPFVLNSEGKDIEEPWSQFEASLVLVHNRSESTSREVQEIILKRLKPKTNFLNLMFLRLFRKLRKYKTSNEKTLYANNLELTLQNCGKCQLEYMYLKYMDFDPIKEKWRLALDIACQLHEKDRPIWHFGFLGTMDDMKWISDAHPTAAPKTCRSWQKEEAKKVIEILEFKKNIYGLDNLEFGDLYEAKARLHPSTRIFWKFMSLRFFYFIWCSILVISYWIFVWIALHRFGNSLIKYNVIDILNSEDVPNFWEWTIAFISAISLLYILSFPFWKLNRWTKGVQRLFSRHKLMQRSRARKAEIGTFTSVYMYKYMLK